MRHPPFVELPDTQTLLRRVPWLNKLPELPFTELISHATETTLADGESRCHQSKWETKHGAETWSRQRCA